MEAVLEHINRYGQFPALRPLHTDTWGLLIRSAITEPGFAKCADVSRNLRLDLFIESLGHDEVVVVAAEGLCGGTVEVALADFDFVAPEDTLGVHGHEVHPLAAVLSDSDLVAPEHALLDCGQPYLPLQF